MPTNPSAPKRPRGRPRGEEKLVSTSLKLPESLPDEVRDAIAMRRMIGAKDGPQDFTNYLVFAARQQIARDRADFDQQFARKGSESEKKK